MTPGDVRKTMGPGQKGTRRFLRDWGDRLVCVRYRFDPARKIRYTTVELVASVARPWAPPFRPRPDALVYLRVDRDDWKALRKVREARAWWDGERGLWRLRYDVAERMRLRNRIVKPKLHLPQAPRYAHRPMATNRNLSENPGKSS
ncbi:MAG TPA: hypothetical protein VF554_00165 [Thermoanaerobaculia bacterium]